MSPTTLLLLDWFLNFLHFAIVMMLCFGWISKYTRRFHRWLLSIVALCWLCIGPIIGKKIGYCPVTDWAWQVRRARGETDLEYGYINYLSEKLGIHMTDNQTDLYVGIVAIGICLATIYLLYRDRKAV